MPKYRFTSTWPEVFSDLEQGVNATLTRGADAPPDGSTIVLVPGDELFINEPYLHAHLVEIDEKPSKPSDPPAEAPAPTPDVPEEPKP